jgi:hypothetical protein
MGVGRRTADTEGVIHVWGDSKLDTIQDAYEHAQTTGSPEVATRLFDQLDNEGVDAAAQTAAEILHR